VTPPSFRSKEANVTQILGALRNLPISVTRGNPLPSHMQFHVHILFITSTSYKLMHPCGKFPSVHVPLQIFIPLSFVRVVIHKRTTLHLLAFALKMFITSSFHYLAMSFLCWDSMSSSLKDSILGSSWEVFKLWTHWHPRHSINLSGLFWSSWFWHRPLCRSFVLIMWW
jgi:hypothetical protein